MAREQWRVLLPVVTLGLAAVIVWWVIRGADESAAGERIGFQDADGPLDAPESGIPDPRLRFLSAWSVARVPLATRFDFPLGSEHGGLTRRAGSPDDAESGDGTSRASDVLTVIGPEEAAIGDPVFAVADGLVLRAASAGDGSGDLVALAHRLEDGTVVQSHYGRLHRIHVVSDALVARGAVIGTLGSPDGSERPGLMFGIRAGEGTDERSPEFAGHHNPIDAFDFIAKRRGADDDRLSPPPLGVPEGEAPWTRLEIRGVEKAPALLAPGEGNSGEVTPGEEAGEENQR